jgi:hypothetical protein
MTPMPTGRRGAAAVTAGNGKIYVVGGTANTSTAACPGFRCTTVEEFTPPTSGGGGTWRGAGDGIGQLPAPRTFLGMALGADGKLYVAGGADGMAARAETYQYDPANPTSPWQPMASMPQPRAELRLAPAGDGKLYAVGGNRAGAVVDTVERFVLPTAGLPLGAWEGPGGIAQLPSPRADLGMVGLPNGGLVAAGGNADALNPVPRSEVYEYDPATNAWADRPPLPTASLGLTLALLGTRQVFAVGGFDSTGPLGTVQAGIRNDLPSVSAGGPYTVQAGSTVQLAASGSDPDGDSLSYAWDLDGSLLYTRSGQNLSFSAVGLSPGTRTVRVRAVDAFGGYALASTTVTITPAPALCNPRPNVAVATTRAGSGRLRATLTAQTLPATPANSLQRIAITKIDNATVSLDGSPVTAGASVPFQAGTTQATLLVQRQSPAVGATVSFTVTDVCGEWKSFVGGGPSAF